MASWMIQLIAEIRRSLHNTYVDLWGRMDCRASNSTIPTPNPQEILPDEPADPPSAPTLIGGEDVPANVQLLMPEDTLIEEQLRS